MANVQNIVLKFENGKMKVGISDPKVEITNLKFRIVKTNFENLKFQNEKMNVEIKRLKVEIGDLKFQIVKMNVQTPLGNLVEGSAS
jgi:hypothetical protein